jgi:tRNA G37 N-methylase Trm5
MPLPKGAYRYLDVAIPVLKDVGVLHFYHWAPQEDLYSEAEQLITQAAINSHREVEFLDHVKVSQYSPGTWKVRVDARLERSQHHSE